MIRGTWAGSAGEQAATTGEMKKEKVDMEVYGRTEKVEIPYMTNSRTLKPGDELVTFQEAAGVTDRARNFADKCHAAMVKDLELVKKRRRKS